MTKFATLKLIAAFGTAATLGLAMQTATAADLEGSKQSLVQYADLDLTRPEGAQTLLRRIQSAAKQVCSGLESRDVMQNAKFEHCISDAVAGAVAKVDRPAFNAYFRAKDKGRSAKPLQVASANSVAAR